MLKTDHPIGPEELMAYLDGELEVERASVAAEHLDRCPDCRKVAVELRGVSRAMLAWEVEESGLQPVSAPRTNARRWWRWKPVLAVVAPGLALVFWATLMNQNRPALSRIADTAGFVSAELPAADASKARAVLRMPASEPADVKIARSAEMELAAADLEAARQALEATVSRHRGYIGTIHVKMDAGSPRWINANLAIPSPELNSALSELRRVGRVVSESQAGEDVTERALDLDARLSNARIAEQRLKEILQQRPGKISEVLEVEREVARVRGEIEKMDAERKGLATRVEFATISVRVNEPLAAPSHGLGTAAREGWRTLAESLTGIAAFLLTAGPSVLLYGAILFFPARFAWKRLRKKSAASA
jgi:hypothetical protein